MRKKKFLDWGLNPRKTWKYREHKICAQDLNFQEDQIESTIGSYNISTLLLFLSTKSIHQAKVRSYSWHKQTKPPGPPASGDPVFVWMKTEGESKRVKILCHSLHIFPDFGSFLELIGYDPEKNSIKILLVIKWRTPFLSWFSRVKFTFSKKATKIDAIFTVDLTLCSKFQIDGEDFVNFCGLLRKHEL